MSLEVTMSSTRSPRRRTRREVTRQEGEDEALLSSSPSKRSRDGRIDFPLARRRLRLKKAEDENDENEAPNRATPSFNLARSPIKRCPAASPLLAASPMKNATTPDKIGPPTSRARRALGLMQVSSPKACSPLLVRAKQALSTSLPEEGVVGRDKELKVMRTFLEGSWNKSGKRRRALYVSGAPGTGKTACLKHLLRQMRLEETCTVVFVNCMGLGSSKEVFARVAQELDPSYDGATPKKYVEAKICGGKGKAKGKNVLLVLDEVDQLDSKEQEVLYSVFEWPQLKGSRLSLVGIANALDLTDKILPRLKVRQNRLYY